MRWQCSVVGCRQSENENNKKKQKKHQISHPTHQRGTVPQFVRPLIVERSTTRPSHQGERFQRSKKLKISDINKSSDPLRGNGSISRPTHHGERSEIRPTHQGGNCLQYVRPFKGDRLQRWTKTKEELRHHIIITIIVTAIKREGHDQYSEPFS